MIQAVLFDMDGVLIDTERYYRAFDREAAKEMGYDLSFELACRLRSLARDMAADLLRKELGSEFDYARFRRRRQELLEAHFGKHGIEKKPGVEETVRELKKRGYRTAVVTATGEERARGHLKSAGLAGLFDDFISASMVEHGKPFPDVYLYACGRLGLCPEDCVAVEDSPNGVEAAWQAGCRVVMVPDLTRPDAETERKLWKVCGSLKDLPGLFVEKTGIDFERAKAEFERYLDGYDRRDDKVKLKIIHTYGVVDCCEEIARRMKLPEEDVLLAKLIGLLHDIGRFEQLKLFDSFLPETMDHAAYGAEILFEQGMIRRFIEDKSWDEIIRTAIDRHSDFAVEGVEDLRTLLHACIIRDADKLDNCRVKLEEKMETLLGIPEEEAGKGRISPEVWQYCLDKKSIEASARKTPVDYWISYVAYFYDINFKETMEIIVENCFIPRIIDRITYTDPDTAAKMKELKNSLERYAEERITEDL